MSIITHQSTCVGCGRPIKENDNINIEPLVDDNIRYVAVHWDCHTFVHHDGPQLTEPE